MTKSTIPSSVRPAPAGEEHAGGVAPAASGGGGGGGGGAAFRYSVHVSAARRWRIRTSRACGSSDANGRAVVFAVGTGGGGGAGAGPEFTRFLAALSSDF